MKDFRGKLAVVTGGGTGMGREIARQLSVEGCHVAMCDVSAEDMAETKGLCEAAAQAGVRISTHDCDVSDERQMIAFRDGVKAAHQTDHVHLLFNNAGIGGGGSLFEDDRADWERTFGVCWFGVYYGTRTFLPLLVASDEAVIVNTSSVNGFWACLGPDTAHTAYSAAKFAVKGFSEALINDFKVNAPHVGVSVVMPGHIGTAIAKNSAKVLGRDPKELSEQQLLDARARMTRAGLPVATLSAEQLRLAMIAMGDAFENDAPTTASQAAKIILDGVRAKKWRILVGHDAHVLDRLVREAPEDAYGEAFMQKLAAEANWKLGT